VSKKSKLEKVSQAQLAKTIVTNKTLQKDNYDSPGSDWDNVSHLGVDHLDTSAVSPFHVKSFDDLRNYGPWQPLHQLRKRAGETRENVSFDVPWVHETEIPYLKEQPWKYRFNEYGFRDEWKFKTKRANIGYFGCSMTFGEGVDTPDLWSTHITNAYKLTGLNFGVGGAGPLRVARTFAAVQQTMKLKYAIIMLPQISRVELWQCNNYHGLKQHPRLHTINLIPNFPPGPTDFTADSVSVYNDYFKVMTDEQSIGQCVQACNWITQTARAHKTQVLFCSWDPFSLWAMRNAGVSNLHNKIFKRLDVARDQMHPGPESNLKFSKSIRRWIDANPWL